MSRPTEEDLEAWKGLGQVMAPFLTIWVATTLAAARFNAAQGMPSSTEWRTGVLRESVQDAVALLKVI